MSEGKVTEDRSNVTTLTAIRSTEYKGFTYAVLEYDQNYPNDYVLDISDDKEDDGLLVDKWPLEKSEFKLVVPVRLEADYAKWSVVVGISTCSYASEWTWHTDAEMTQKIEARIDREVTRRSRLSHIDV